MFFASLPFLAYLSYKRPKPPTHCVHLGRKSAESHQKERARKPCSATLTESAFTENIYPFIIYCCGASVVNEQQHNQDLRIYRREYEFFLPEYIAFNQSALCHEQHRLSRRRPFSREFR